MQPSIQTTRLEADPFAMPRWSGLQQSDASGSKNRARFEPEPRQEPPRRERVRHEQTTVQPAPESPTGPEAQDATEVTAAPPAPGADRPTPPPQTAEGRAAAAEGLGTQGRAAATSGTTGPAAAASPGAAGAPNARPLDMTEAVRQAAATPPPGNGLAPAPAAANGATRGTSPGNPAAAPVLRAATATARPLPTRPAPQLARSGDPQLLARAEAAHQGIIRAIALHSRPDGGTFRVQLTPADLGALDVELTVEELTHAKVTVIADRPETAATIEQHLPDLARALAAQGLTVDEARVEVRDPSTDARQRRGDPDDHADGGNDPLGAAELSAVSRLLRDPRLLAAGDGGVDLWT